MFVVFNELYVQKEGRNNVVDRFATSAEKMRKVSGCLDFMFLNPIEEEDNQIVLTKWESKEDYESWVNSKEFKEAHQQRRANLHKSPTSGNKISTFEVKHHL